jgi:BolA protein
MGSVSDALERKLQASFSPARLQIDDESARHSGHAGARPDGETHFRVIIEAAAFFGLSRLERQRLVHEALAEELAGQVHALSVTALAPGEK